jgi:tetratricopeptide (TPR) repeat protein
VLIPASPRRAVPYLEAALKFASAQPEGGVSDVLQDDLEAHAQEALGRALLAAGERGRSLELLRRAVATFERLLSQAPQIVEYRFDLIQAMNGLGDALPSPESADFYRRAFIAAAAFPAAPRNTRELLSQAEVNLRWPRWNAGAPAAERRRKLEIALQFWQRLATYAPNNRSVQVALAEARRSLGQAQ